MLEKLQFVFFQTESQSAEKKMEVFCSTIEKTLVSPTGLNQKPLKKPKIGKEHFSKLGKFSEKMSSVSRIVPEKPSKSSMLAKRFVSSKNRGRNMTCIFQIWKETKHRNRQDSNPRLLPGKRKSLRI